MSDNFYPLSLARSRKRPSIEVVEGFSSYIIEFQAWVTSVWTGGAGTQMENLDPLYRE